MTASSDSSPALPVPPDVTPSLKATATGSALYPEAESRSPRKWLGLLALVLLAAGVGFALWKALAGGGQPEMQGPQAVPVKMERLQEESIEDSTGYVGTLDSQAGVSLQPEADGRVTQIFVTSGEQVSAGQPVMQLSSGRSQADYSAALSNVTAASAARNAAEAQLRAAIERRAQVEADLSLQTSDYDRTATLVNQGALAREVLDQVVRDRAVAQASLNSTIQEIEALRASRDQAEATLTQANDNADATQQDLLDKTVTAPISGIVGDIPIKLGAYVTTDDQLATITQNDNLDLEIAVDISNASRLRTGLPVELTLAGQSDPIATGNITFVSPTTDPRTQTVLAKARFSSSRQPLQDNQRLSVRVIWDERPGILIPTTAVSRLGGQTFVFVPGKPEPPAEGEASSQGAPGGSAGGAQGNQGSGQQEGPPPTVAKLIPVTLGDLQGNEYQVIEGLQAGDTVITSGLLNLRDGVPIAPESESGNKDAQPPGEAP